MSPFSPPIVSLSLFFCLLFRYGGILQFFFCFLFLKLRVLVLDFFVCGYQVYSKESFIYTIVLFILNAPFLPWPLQIQTFTLLYIFLVTNFSYLCCEFISKLQYCLFLSALMFLPLTLVTPKCIIYSVLKKGCNILLLSDC